MGLKGDLLGALLINREAVALIIAQEKSAGGVTGTTKRKRVALLLEKD